MRSESEMRPRFEAWARGCGFGLSKAGGQYLANDTFGAWEAWKHLASQPQAPAAAVPDGWSPSDAEVRAWRDRYDLDGALTLSEARTAIDDARSLHMLAAAPAPEVSGG